MGKIRRVLAGVAGAWLVTFAAVVGIATVWPMVEPDPAKADLIVVLGGGMDADGTLHQSSRVRVDRAVALWRTGAAPRLHFTGGSEGGVSSGEAMAARAELAGVPREAMSTERRSQSTLQNALFSRYATAEVQSVILVTEAFHLPRSWASFRVFGTDDITLIHAPAGRETTAQLVRMMVREATAIWFNAARLILWWLVGFTGLSVEERDALLY